MDSFLEVIITIAMVALFLFPSLLKSVKEVNKKQAPHVPPSMDEDMPEVDDFLHKKASEIPKQEEYFTYETMDGDLENAMSQTGNLSSSETQQAVNKEEGELLSMEEDEIIKGVVYAEILKRKF